MPGQILPVDTDQHPPSTQWMIIDSPHFEVIVPANIIREGQRAAHLLERAYAPLAKTLNVLPKRIALILTNQGVISNGLVQLAPRFSEWFMTPPQSGFGGAIDWLPLLAAHEGRHIVQLDKLDQGFTRAMSLLFGDLGRAAFTLMSAPIWYLEGDAVGTETALTGAGRGRQPEFEMMIRTLLLSGRTYSYDKAFLRSFKDYYPDYYHLGYLLTTYLRRALGSDSWSEILDGAARGSYWVFAFDRALKEESGRSASELYDEAMRAFGDIWRRELEGLELTPARSLNARPSSHWTNYIRPEPQPDGSVICQKFGLDDSPTLVRLGADGHESTIRRFAPLELYATQATAQGGRIAWCELEPDARWGKKSYGVIVDYDLRTGRSRRLTRSSRFLNASLSPDGKRLAAVEFGEDGRCRIYILDAETGRPIGAIPNPDNAYLMTPSWDEDCRRIVFARQSAQGRGIAEAELETGSTKEVLPDGPEAVSDPVFFDRYVLYHSPRSGIDNIYALDVESRRQWRVTSARFGAFYPRVTRDRKKLVFSSYSVDGLDAVEAPLDPSAWTEVSASAPRSLALYQPLVDQEQGKNILAPGEVPATEFPVSDYSPSAHMFNVHSWGLVPTTTEASLLFLSNDILNKASLIGGPNWNYNEKTLGFSLSGSYRAWFPIIEVSADYGGRSSTFEDASGNEHRYGWKESRLAAGLSLPLNLSRGIYASSLTLGAGISFRKAWDRNVVGEGDLGNGTLVPLSYSAAFSRVMQAAPLDLRPPWGQRLSLVFRHTPWRAGDYEGRLFSISGDAYFPGLARHHSLIVGAAYEEQDPADYRFESEIIFPRGYDYAFHRKLGRISVDYALPLAYPDLALGSLVFLKRISVNLFYDHGRAWDGGLRTEYDSAGLDLLFDACFMRIPITINFGLRTSYRFTDRTVRFQPLILGFAF